MSALQVNVPIIKAERSHYCAGSDLIQVRSAFLHSSFALNSQRKSGQKGNLLKIHFVTIDVAVEPASDFAVGFVDDGLHGFVVREHLSGEPANAVAPRNAHQML